jgi:hypothetical protein
MKQAASCGDRIRPGERAVQETVGITANAPAEPASAGAWAPEGPTPDQK